MAYYSIFRRSFHHYAFAGDMLFMMCGRHSSAEPVQCESLDLPERFPAICVSSTQQRPCIPALDVFHDVGMK